MKKWVIQIILLPNMRSVAAYLKMKDADSTGSDDAAAFALEKAADALDEWLAAQEPQS